jgi:hypothetical protein
VLTRPAEGKGVIETKGNGLLLGLVFPKDTAFPLWTARFKMISMIHKSLWASIQKRAREMQQRDYSPKAPVTYNPLDYAAEPAEAYWRLLSQGTQSGPKRALFLGMNPGPWGMGQTGVPFGDPQMVREWMGIKGEVRQPESPLASRPVVGLESPRSEVSGSRLWGLIAKYYPRAADFFQHYVVWNYCPLIFFDPQDRNLTPDKLPRCPQGSLGGPLRSEPLGGPGGLPPPGGDRRGGLRREDRPACSRQEEYTGATSPSPQSGQPGGQSGLGGSGPPDPWRSLLSPLD